MATRVSAVGTGQAKAQTKNAVGTGQAEAQVKQRPALSAALRRAFRFSERIAREKNQASTGTVACIEGRNRMV